MNLDNVFNTVAIVYRSLSIISILYVYHYCLNLHDDYDYEQLLFDLALNV